MEKEYIDRNALLNEISKNANRSMVGEASPPYLDWKDVVCSIKDMPHEEVISKAEHDAVLRELAVYRRICGDLVIKDDEVVGTSVGKEVIFIRSDTAKILRDQAVENAVEETTRKLVHHFANKIINACDKHKESMQNLLDTYKEQEDE